MSDTEDFVIVDRPKVSSEIAKLSAWLQPTAYREQSCDFYKHLNAHVPGTGNWLGETPEYQEWHDTDSHGVLWIKAIAGAGKSVLTASWISQLQQNEHQAIVLFFFVRQIVTANHESHALVRDWLDQLLPHSPSLRAALEARRKKSSSAITEIGFAELWQILTDALLSMFTQVYCVADALDELDTSDTSEFLQCLIALSNQKPRQIKAFVSSRPLPQIQKLLGGVSTVKTVRLENRLVNRDISRFIEYRLDQERNVTDEVRDEIKRSIENRVYPSFLYARLMLKELLEGPKSASLDIQSVHKVLNSIPVSLEDLYSHMLNDHSIRASVPQERQVLILRLATHATRPLRLLEIAAIVDFLGLQENHTTQGNVKNLTRMSCGPLLEILPDETVSVIHHSFTEFLVDATRADRANMNSINFPVIDADETNYFMAIVCVRYLLFGGLTTWKRQEVSRIYRDPWKDMQLAQLEFPFIEYAACNWYVHVSRLPEVKGELLELLNTFTKPENPSFLAFVELVMKIEGESDLVRPLHVCAWGHMTSYAKALIQSGHDCNALDGQKKTPLTRATIKGFPDMVALLLEHGANPNSDVDRSGKIPLHYAAERSDYRIVKLLLEAGGNPLIHRSSKYDPPQCVIGYDPERHKSPLEYACQAGAIQSVRAMLSYLTSKDLESAMQCSIKARQLNIIKLLIDLPDMKAAENGFRQQCLILAADTRDPLILQLFLDFVITSGNTRLLTDLLLRFCDSLGRDRLRRYNPSDGDLMCLDLILQNGCDVNARKEIGRTALHACVTAQTPALVDKLLEYGADVHATDRNGNTPLHLLVPGKRSSDTSLPILHALLRSGAQLNVASTNHRGDAPLLAWCRRCSVINGLDVDLLRPHVKDWNVVDSEGNTPIHLLVKGNADKETIKKVVELGADPNWRNYEGFAPLHYTKSIDQVRMLIDVGADLEARDYQGRTPFLRTIIAHDARRQLSPWLELGVDLHATDYEGNGALHLLCKNNRSFDGLLMMFDAGLNPNHRNHRGDTLWHTFMRHVLEYNHDNLVSIVYLLRRADVCLAARNHEGQTLLHCICANVSASDETGNNVAHLLVAKRRIDTKKLFNISDNPIDHLPITEINNMIEVEDHQGQRPIHLAAARSEALVGWLISRGATVTSKTHQGRNPLHIAAEAEASSTIGLILENYKYEQQRKIAVNEADKDGRTPLHIACRSGCLESVILLLEAGADVTLADKKQETPLHACAHFKRHPQWPESGQPNDDRRHKVFDDDETLRVIVETFNADVNVRTYENFYMHSLRKLSNNEPHRSVLHILAVGEHWWQTEAIRYLLQHGEDVKMRDAEGRTPLHIAVTGGYRRLVTARLLLEHGADPNALDRKGVTPLGFAAGSPEMVRLLLRHGGKIELGSKPVLFEAIRVQAFDTIRVIVESGFDIQGPFKQSLAELDTYEKAKVILHRGSSAETIKREEEWLQSELRLLLCHPLHYAAHGRFNNVSERHKAVAIVELLLAHGADPWLSYGDKTTIIHDVLHQGGIVEPLLALPHLELERRDGRSRTLLMAACEVRSQDSSRMRQAFNNLEPRPSASMQKRYAVDRLCEMGANVSASDETGNNVAHLLVATGQVSAKEVLPVLVANCPALVLQKNQQMETPLHIAAETRQWDIVRTLLDFGADPLTPDSKGNTILHYLARCLRDEERLNRLMGFPGSHEQTLDINAWKEMTLWKDFSRLLDLGVNINTRNHNGETPIFEYVRGLSCKQSLHSPITDTLVVAGADILVRNDEGESLLHIVAKSPCNGFLMRCKCKETFAEPFTYLMEQGLDPFQEDSKQRTPVDVAAAYGKEGILALFTK